ncbi:MAG: class I SAM-dependent methyltransferase [Oscillatoria sp. PMC 1051.18]|nr:class I SAM-dependent methyltransferase [Oscillatoria sp. PMC 1050.18]MEC5030829.1 class I SAM-dependent methyltransferase [Oscillatoria sp. PMC 1051.18]
MNEPEVAYQQALEILTQKGLQREFIENASLKINHARQLIEIGREKKPSKILEIGIFVGVSSAILGLCLPETHIVSIDPGLPVEIQDILAVRKFNIQEKRTNLSFVSELLNDLKIADRFTLTKGFFSCCFPNQEDREKVVNYGIKLDKNQIVGKHICEQYQPFDLVFLDADHRTSAVASDLKLVYPYLASGGKIILHDVGLDYWGKQVRRGVEEFLAENSQVKFEIEGEIGYLYEEDI